jgi:hypothetical protein
MTNLSERLSAKNIWGKVILYLRENRLIALHVACGDITDVRLEGNNLIVRVDDGMMLNLLSDGKRELERAISWQGLDLNLTIEAKQIKNQSDEDIEKLKKIVGNYLEIK